MSHHITINRRIAAGLLPVTGAVVLAVGGTALPANAVDFAVPSCPGFDVGVTNLTSHGNPVQAGPRPILGAWGGTYMLDNETTGATITVRTAGAGTFEENPDGSFTFTHRGQTVLFSFATDAGGPASTMYTGELVVQVDADGNGVAISHTGPTVDVCALLGS
jgi:hypothetical protein